MQHTTTAGVPALTFQQTSFDVIDQAGRPWLRGPQIADALGYSQPNRIADIYNRNADEFTSEMTALLNLSTAGGSQDVRIFSLRGAYMLGMLARTKEAKAFRVWVLDVLDGQGAADAGDLQATVETAVLLQQKLTETERQRDALLAVVREQVLDKYPHFRKALKYHVEHPTLSYQEKATLMGWKSTTAWTECLRKMDSLGLICYTPDPKLQENGRAAMAKLRAMQGQAPATPAASKAPRKGSVRPRQGPISAQQAQHLEKMRTAAAQARARKRANLESARQAMGEAAASSKKEA